VFSVKCAKERERKKEIHSYSEPEEETEKERKKSIRKETTTAGFISHLLILEICFALYVLRICEWERKENGREDSLFH
jgi:hypothetical protein